ncbi:thioesterase family protein [Salsipaludibacter albus]|uniref:thioesterase family protein n=1 Tax=Salsipaludibacter albus TaxID=2849650 RepID=UPI001EE45EA6|nr:thioesterase family protein [Salsipaludibacter albus]
MTDAYFTTDDGRSFRPTAFARGPWDPDACHAGPPTALLVRAVERLATRGGLPDDVALARLSVELDRPIPMDGFVVDAGVRRTGRTASATEATIIDGHGRTCARAAGLHLATVDLPTPSAPVDVPDLAAAVDGDFPVPTDRMGGEWFFSHSIEVRYDPSGGRGEGGPTTMWMRSLPIVAGEEPSPRQRLGPLADCGNGISWNTSPNDVACVNPDLTLTMLREPVGEWFASRASTHTGAVGIGYAHAELFDVDGLVGHAIQTVVLREA